MLLLNISVRYALAAILLISFLLVGLGSCVNGSNAKPVATTTPPPEQTATSTIPVQAQVEPTDAAQPAMPASTGTAQPERSVSTVTPQPEALVPTSVREPANAVSEPAQEPWNAASQQILLPTIINGMAATTGGWHQLGGDPQRTHYASSNLPAPTGSMSARNQDWRVLWIWNGPTSSGGPAANHLSLPDSVAPMAGDGRLYVGHNDGVVRAISAADGFELWSRSVGGRILNVGAYDAATQAVYFASDNGRLYKLRASDGTPLGEYNAGSEIEGAVLLVGDQAYIGTANGRLIAVNTASMTVVWTYEAGAAIYASAAYSTVDGGLIIALVEDASVHAVRVADGARAWRTPINAYPRPERPTRPERRFPDLYPVVAEQAGVVIVRSYFDWELTWTPNGGAPANQEETRQFIADQPQYESFFVLELASGERRFTAPVLGGAIGNGSYYYSSPPQAVVRRLPDGRDVAYLFWRNRTACLISASSCDGREDTTFGEMDLSTGAIRFVQDQKNSGIIRVPTDEQGALTMVDNVLFHSHWMLLGAIRIPDRTIGGASYGAPIPSQPYLSVSNTMAANQCAERNTAQRFCPVGHSSPGDSYQLNPGFYIYAHTTNVYDQFWHPPVRGPIFDSGVLYWRSSDGAIIALAPVGTTPPTPEPSASTSPTTETPEASTTAITTATPVVSATPVPSPTPGSGPESTPEPVFLPLISA